MRSSVAADGRPVDRPSVVPLWSAGRSRPRRPPAHAGPGREDTVVFADTLRGSPVGWRLDEAPHLFLTGSSPTGVARTAGAVAAAAANGGADVRCCDCRRTMLLGVPAWPNLTRAARPAEVVELISRTWAEMRQRYSDLQADPARAVRAQRILLAVDDVLLLSLGLHASWPGPGHPGEADPQLVAQLILHQLSDLLIMGPAALVHVLLAGQPGSFSFLPWEALDQFGARAAVGRIGAAWAVRLFGSSDACRDVPVGVPDAGVVLGPAGPLTVAMRRPPGSGDCLVHTGPAPRRMPGTVPAGQACGRLGGGAAAAVTALANRQHLPGRPGLPVGPGAVGQAPFQPDGTQPDAAWPLPAGPSAGGQPAQLMAPAGLTQMRQDPCRVRPGFIA
jgi:hypothetical protein